MPLFCFGSWKYRRQGSSVNIDPTIDWTTGVRSPAEAMDFSSSLCVQTSSHSHPASYPMGTGGLFPGVKRGRGVMITAHTHLVPKSRVNRSYTSCPPCYVHDGGRTTLLYLKMSKTNALWKLCSHTSQIRHALDKTEAGPENFPDHIWSIYTLPKYLNTPT
jgi:hypothetical protein